jgi:hypothetical protein
MDEPKGLGLAMLLMALGCTFNESIKYLGLVECVLDWLLFKGRPSRLFCRGGFGSSGKREGEGATAVGGLSRSTSAVSTHCKKFSAYELHPWIPPTPAGLHLTAPPHPTRRCHSLVVTAALSCRKPPLAGSCGLLWRTRRELATLRSDLSPGSASPRGTSVPAQRGFRQCRGTKSLTSSKDLDHPPSGLERTVYQFPHLYMLQASGCRMSTHML